MVEMADTSDLRSDSYVRVWVQVPLGVFYESADVMELVDMIVLETIAVLRTGSSPVIGIIL